MVRTLDFGGSERQCAVTATSLDRGRFDAYVGVFRREGFRVHDVEAAGIPVVQFDVRSFGSRSHVSATAQMCRFIRDRKIRLVHTFDVPATLFGVPAAWAARGPVVLSSGRAYRSLVPGWQRAALRLTDRLAAGIVVNCEAMREHLVRDEGVPRSKTHLCYNGIEVNVFHGSRLAHKPAEFGAAELVIGVVCGLREEKGLDVLMAAFSKVASRHRGLRLVFVGSGVYLGPLEAQASELGVREQVVFLPARREVADLLRGIDIFVLASRSEALSNSLMEAMSCGCCVIASDVGGNPELVRDNCTGLLFARNDVEGLVAQLHRVIEDGQLRRRLAAAGQQTIQGQFSQQANAIRMQAIYSQFLTSASAS
jgi:glycosyltransferase involved in cell wall biosynthesis